MNRITFLLLLFLSFLCIQPALAQTSTVKIMCWNLLNYPDPTNTPNDTALRHPYYRTVVEYANPDILVTEENTSGTATTWFLNDVMNINGLVYNKANFINGWDTDNMIYFRDSLFDFLGNKAIKTDVRDINEFTLVHTATGDTLRIYAVHLKASSGSSNEQQRAVEADSLRKVTNALPANSNFIVCGDFNFYGDYEPAYPKLLADNISDDGNFIDPLSMTGVWNRYLYRAYHTQSTRTSSFGGGAGGGLDDRFDMMLYSTAISQGTNGISYVAGSTTPLGNDGNHYQDAIYIVPNTAAPADVLNALYYAADHLPVFALFNFSNPNYVASKDSDPFRFNVYPNPATSDIHLSYELNTAANVKIRITDIIGREVFTSEPGFEHPGKHEIPITLPSSLEKGIYFINFQVNSKAILTKLIRF